MSALRLSVVANGDTRSIVYGDEVVAEFDPTIRGADTRAILRAVKDGALPMERDGYDLVEVRA